MFDQVQVVIWTESIDDAICKKFLLQVPSREQKVYWYPYSRVSCKQIHVSSCFSDAIPGHRNMFYLF